MKLLELFNYITESILLEDRLDHLKQTFGQKILVKYLQDEGEDIANPYIDKEALLSKSFGMIVQADPNPQKKFTQWLIKLYLSGAMSLEELPKATELLQLFMANQRSIPADKKQIMAYKSLQELAEVVQQYEGKVPELSQREKDRKIGMEMHSDEHSETIYNSPTMKVVIPKTEAASCYFGKNTEWCTAATTSNNMFHQYNEKGKLYIIIMKKENERFQFHFESRSFMDENDYPIDADEVFEKYPEIKKAFTSEQLMGMIPIKKLYEQNDNQINDYIMERLYKAYDDADLYMGKYNQDSDTFNIQRYGELSDILRTWYSEGSDMYRVWEGEYFEDSHHETSSQEIEDFLNELEDRAAKPLYKELLKKYKESGEKLSRDDREELSELARRGDLSGYVDYFADDLGFDGATEVKDNAYRAVSTGIASGSRDEAAKDVVYQLENLDEFLESEEIDVRVMGFRMEEQGKDYALTAMSSGVIDMAQLIEDDIAEGGMGSEYSDWTSIMYAEDIEPPYNGWDGYDEKEATEVFIYGLADDGWEFAQ